MDVQIGPDSIDEPSLLYKLQRKIKVFNTKDPLPNRGYNLVANSSKYGLVFIAVPDGTLSVYQLSQLIDLDCEPQHLTVKLQEKPTHIAVSCDHELLAVTGGNFLTVYKVADFQNTKVSPSFSTRTEVDPSTYVSAVQWNPCIPDSIVIAFYDGTLLACQVYTGQVKKVVGRARCICWSPKGKQLVTGNSDGSLIQYKPELTAAKLIQAPNLFDGAPVEALAIYWISTFQFAVVYRNATDNSRPTVTIMNTAKGNQPGGSCLSYEDICYSMGSNRPWYYYLQGLAQWNIIMTASSNSMEMATLGSTDGANWVQWCQIDEARLELPLTDKKIENYPVGLSIDTCAIHQLPWGENETLPHMPLLHVVSQNGLLTTFNVINLKREAVQSCCPPHLLALPAQGLTSSIPGAVAPPAPTVVPAAPQPQPPVPAVQQAQLPIAQPIPQPNSVSTSATIKIPSFTPQSNQPSIASTNQQPQQRVGAETTAAPAPQPQATVAQPKPQPAPQPAVVKAQTQDNAALKAEQEKASKAKANQELKDMLVKEVNDFQTELYNFMVKTRETQARLQRDIDIISTNFKEISLDTEELKKECSIEELRGAIVQLKLELVRACAVVAEARTHSDAKDLHQWTQADPLTTKRVASVKKLAYYVQSQLAQAHAALDYKWNEIASRDPEYNKPGKRMIRPILDDVYQPLVKQQEILSRQQAVLRTLKSTLAECDVGPVFKSTSLLRSTPFRNNKDPLSKLTKNILNMSLEPETKPKRQLLTPSKLDALREVLSNHKTVKIKPVNVEIKQHLETLKKNYEKSVREKAEKSQSLPSQAKPPKPEPVKQAPAATLAPVTTVKPAPAPSNVVRTLFIDEPKQEVTAPHPTIPRPVAKPYVNPPATAEATVTDTKSVLKDVLTNRQANLEAKNNSNTFMGQKICSPTTFAQPSAPTPSSAPSAVFTSKPIAEINNMINKFQPQPFVPETKSKLNAKQTEKPAPSNSNIKSSETGEPEETAPKQMTNLFGMKTPLATSTPLPAMSKIADQKPQAAKPMIKIVEKAKENVPEKGENTPNTAPSVVVKKETKPLSSQANKSFAFGGPQSNEASETSTSSGPKSLDLRAEVAQKELEKPIAASSASVFASSASISTSKSQSAFTAPTTNINNEPLTPTDSEPSSTSSSASSIFGAAVASQPKTTSSFSSPTSVFTSTPSTVIFGTTPPVLTSSSANSQSQPNRLVTTSTNSIFEPVSTSQPISSNTAPVLSMTACPQATYITDPLRHQAAANSGGSIFKPSPISQLSTTETPTVSQPTTTVSEFGSSSVTVKPVFESGMSAYGTATTTASLFGTPSTAATVTIFGSETPSVVSSTTTVSIFGSATPSESSSATTPSIFGSATPSVESVFGATTAVSSASSVFSSKQDSIASTESTSAFTPTTTTASLFGGTTQASSVFAQAAQSVFGAPTQASIFGATPQASVFSPTTQASVFGNSTTTQASIFGSPTQTTQTSIFGTQTATTQASVFGSPTQGSSVFGKPTQASVFGTPTQTSQASIFGTPSQTTQPSVFGTPTQSTQASVFGTPTQTTQASIFGQPATTVQGSGSLFGGGETNLFAAASISTTNASSPNSGGNIFGGSSGSMFGGGGTNVFGGKASFGQPNPAVASIFAGGGTTATNIWGSGTTSGGGFGSSAFGQPAATQASSIFGGTGGGSFSQPSAGAFSATPQQPAFGSPTQQQQVSAFGGTAVFGGKSQFGQPAGFGSPTSGGFGSPAAFGGFSKSPGGGTFGAPAFGGGSAFGGSSPGGGFGTSTQSNATFENLATQNTLTFGNLAQQSGPPQPAAPSFNTSPAFSGWRG